jgi:hypothetical protein
MPNWEFLWKQSTGYAPYFEGKVDASDNKVSRVREALEDHLGNVEWANTELGSWVRRRRSYPNMTCRAEVRLRHRKAMACRMNTERILKAGKLGECEEVVRTWFDKTELAPDRMKALMTRRVP